MFALEISFQDGVSKPERIFIRRPHAIIGASDFAHVVIEDLKELNTQLRLVREIGRHFRCKPLGKEGSLEMSSLLEGSYEGQATIDLGPIRFHLTALDTDLMLKDSEPPDRAGVRVLRRACSASSPLYPAIVVRGANSAVVSFVPDQPVYIGRSKQCTLRLDATDVSAKHARMGFEGGEFWIEDLGSTNGTFVDGQQISGRVNIPPGRAVNIGRDVTIIGVTGRENLESAASQATPAPGRPGVERRQFPALISVSEVARPARLVIPLDSTINLGRDPSSELWLGAPHVSRKHCAVSMSKTGLLTVTDFSTNGTSYDAGGILRRGDILEVHNEPKVFDFGGGVTVALCFNEQQEESFVAAHGAAHVFSGERAAGDEWRDSLVSSPGLRGGSASGVTAGHPLGFVESLLRFYGALTIRGKVSLVATLLLGLAVVVMLIRVLLELFHMV